MSSCNTQLVLSPSLSNYHQGYQKLIRKQNENFKLVQNVLQINSRQRKFSIVSHPAKIEERKMSTLAMSPRLPSPPRSTTPRAGNTLPEYDARLDQHQQTYVLSQPMMTALRKTMTNQKGRVFTEPTDKIGFHGPSRRPLLLSYPASPRHVGRAKFIRSFRRSQSASPERSSLPATKSGKETIKLAYNMRTSESKDDNPAPKRLPRPKTVPPPQSRTERLAKEKGFILDGIALSSIQVDFGKVQPKLGAAIPPYNSHLDPHTQNYFTFKGLEKTLLRTGQTPKKSESIQGRAVDRFHYVGAGYDYLSRRNKSGSGYSRDVVDGHGQFLTEIRPMSGYNGKFGFRRNTPLLRHCPSPFGTASRSTTF